MHDGMAPFPGLDVLVISVRFVRLGGFVFSIDASFPSWLFTICLVVL